MKAWFQHHFNTLHVYCRLCKIFSRRHAKALANRWGQSRIYQHLYREPIHVS